MFTSALPRQDSGNAEACHILGTLHAVVALQIKPELMRCVEVARQPERGIGRDTAPLAHDLVDTCWGHIQRTCQCITGKPKWNHKFLPQLLTGVDRGLVFYASLSPSVVIHNFNVFRALRCPYKTHSELIVDADAVLSLALAAQGLQPVAGRGSHIAQLARCVQLIQLAPCFRFNVRPANHPMTMLQGFSIFSFERLIVNLPYIAYRYKANHD